MQINACKTIFYLLMPKIYGNDNIASRSYLVRALLEEHKESLHPNSTLVNA